MRLNWLTALVCWISLSVGGSKTVPAGMVIETEAGGLATNNTSATAELIGAGSFTLDANPDIFTAANAGLSGTALSATAVGELGSGTFDIDFWRFTMIADGHAWFDVDGPANLSSVLHVFNSTGTLIALDRFSFFDLDGNGTIELDSGSGSMLDPFIGAVFLAAGDYFVAISEDPNQATGGGVGTFSMQTSSFFPVNSPWTSVTGAAVGNDGFLVPGVEQSGANSYRLHISQVSPPETTHTPEPPGIALFGMGGLMLFGYGWRRRRKMQDPSGY